MASTPGERDAALVANGGRLLLAGAILAVIGLVLAVLLDGTAAGIGVALASLASVPVVAGLGMLLSGLVERRSRAGKPFA